ncbi:MAG TPA: sigma factor-like helix-turn-helix DNA-binding protein [Propionibacteriaceae bacterium]|nr:sigma factor-like helix-turn-helix DNA-binding protein [Propionibacteriaceae bacterium]
MPPLDTTVATFGGQPATASQDPQLTSWVVSLSQGDLEAFAAFYDATSGFVYGLVVTVLRCPASAARLTQEIYVEVWRDPNQLIHRQVTVLAVLVAMAHRRAVQVARSSDRSSPDNGYRRHRLSLPRVTRLDRAVLTPLQQEIVVLAYLGGYTVRQVSALLGVTPTNVRAALTGALTGLREANLATT